MPLHAEALINDRLITMVTDYLQTLDPKIFPFTANFDDARRNAFVRDLRIGLSDLTESGSKRGTASVGYITSDARLREILRDWSEADGAWAKGQDPRNPLGVASVLAADEADREDHLHRHPQRAAQSSGSGQDSAGAAPARSKKLPTEGEGTRWVVGDGSNTVPVDYPIKGNANSKIYHPEASPSYAITIAEIYFRDEETAQAFGYRLPKNMGAATVTFGKDLADIASEALDGKE